MGPARHAPPSSSEGRGGGKPPSPGRGGAGSVDSIDKLRRKLNGHTIVFNNTSEVMTVDGQAANGAGQRVRAILTPRNAASAPEANTPTAPALRTSPDLSPTSKP